MLSSLTTLIPVLTGPNYQVWAPAMKSFLMSQGHWRVLSHPCPYDITHDKDGNPIEGNKLPSQEKIDENQEKIENWEDDNSKAVGNITLRLSLSGPLCHLVRSLQTECYSTEDTLYQNLTPWWKPYPSTRAYTRTGL